MSRATEKFIVLCGQIVGNQEHGFEIEYAFDGKVFSDRQAAIKHGFDIRGSDDFNIGVLSGKKLKSLDWMTEPGDTDPEVLIPIQEGLFL